MNRPQIKSVPMYVSVTLSELKALKRGYPNAAREIAIFLIRNGIATDAQASKHFHGTWKSAAKTLYEEARQLYGGVEILNPKYPFKGKPGAARSYDLDWYWRLAALVEKIKSRMQKQGLRPTNDVAIRRILARSGSKKLQVYEDQWIKQYAHHNAAIQRVQNMQVASSICLPPNLVSTVSPNTK